MKTNKSFSIIVMAAIMFSMLACGGGDKPFSGTYVNSEDGISIIFTGNQIKIVHDDGKTIEGAFRLIEESKEKGYSKGVIVTADDDGEEKMDYILEGNRLTIHGMVFTKKEDVARSDNSKNSKNKDVLGKFPAAYVKAANETEALRKEMRSANNPGNREKYQKKEDAIENRKEKSATKEFEKIKGKSVPFEIINEDENFTVESVTITDANIKTGALRMSVMIRAKKDLPANARGDVYYLLLNSKDEVYNVGSIDPYATIQVQRARRNALREGEFTNENGSNIMLYCASYDHTDFAKIWFVKEADYYGIQQR